MQKSGCQHFLLIHNQTHCKPAQRSEVKSNLPGWNLVFGAFLDAADSYRTKTGSCHQSGADLHPSTKTRWATTAGLSPFGPFFAAVSHFLIPTGLFKETNKSVLQAAVPIGALRDLPLFNIDPHTLFTHLHYDFISRLSNIGAFVFPFKGFCPRPGLEPATLRFSPAA